MGVCATIPKSSVQGDLTYLLRPRQADLPVGSGERGPPSASSREPLAPLRWASKARSGAHPGCEMGLITLSWLGGSVTWMLGALPSSS